MGHALIGFSEDPKQFLLDMRTYFANTDNAWGDAEIQYAVKKFQVWNSNRCLVLMQGPCYTTMENYKTLVTKSCVGANAYAREAFSEQTS